MKTIITAFFGMLSLCAFAQENNGTEPWTSSRPDGHAPISVMADHVHHKNEWMFSYRFMTMSMNDLQFDNEQVDNSFVFNNYMAAPKEMTMNMHMIGAMYAPLENLTLMLMGNYISNKMSSITKMGENNNMATEGFGDISIMGLYRIFNKNRTSLHAQAGFVLPTGSTDEEGSMQMMHDSHPMTMAYPMQLGSGSTSATLGLTYLWQDHLFSGGAQANSLIRLNENDQGYQLGNEYDFTSWLAIKATNFMSFSVRGQFNYTEAIDGANSSLNPMMVTSADTENSGGLFINYAFGANFYVLGNAFKGLRFGTELSLPLYQEPNGVQLTQDYTLSLGTQYSF